MSFSRNVTYIPATVMFTDADDEICEGPVSFGKQTFIPSEYRFEKKKKDAKKASHQKSSSINQLHYEIEMVSTKPLVEGRRKTESGNKNQNSITGKENKFAPYHPPTKKPVIERPSHTKKIAVFPSLSIRKDD